MTGVLIFWGAFLTLVPAGALVASTSSRVRDILFVALVFGTTLTSRLDINFMERMWYRGTTRAFEVSFVDMLLLALFLGLAVKYLRERKGFYWPPGLGVLIIYFLYCCLSVIASEPKLFGLFELVKILRGLLVFVTAALYLRTPRTVSLLLFAIASALIYEGAMAVYQRYVLNILRVPGTVDHPQALGNYCVVAVPLMLAALFADFRASVRLLYGIALFAGITAVLLSISRTGIAALALAGIGTALVCLSFRVTPKRLALLAVASLLPLAMVYKASDLFTQRFREVHSTEKGRRADTEFREQFYTWANRMAADHLLGVGLNNFPYAVSNTYETKLFRPYPASDFQGKIRGGPELGSLAPPPHSIFAATIGELGWPGLFIFSLLWFRFLAICVTLMLRRPATLDANIAAGAFFSIIALFMYFATEWTFKLAPTFFLVHTILGCVAALRARCGRRVPASLTLRQSHSFALTRPVSSPILAVSQRNALEQGMQRLSAQGCGRDSA